MKARSNFNARLTGRREGSLRASLSLSLSRACAERAGPACRLRRPKMGCSRAVVIGGVVRFVNLFC